MNDLEYQIKKNIESVSEKVERAAKKSGRKLQDINIIAVTKTIDADNIIKAIDSGIKNLGENRVQEFCEKYDIIKRECDWHLIGHLQTNKVKYIIDKISMIHSVDSIELADEIQKKSEKYKKQTKILIQVNVSGEESKYGIHTQNVMDVIKQLSTKPNIKVKGLMTVAPFSQNPEEIRYVFKGLKKIFIDIRQENIDNIDMEFLSMGMSNDFEVAIEEGANMVRIGSAIFGSRISGQ
jgi:PLP dependent protein